MSKLAYDLIIIGAGSGGLVAARFAAQLGARVALAEKNRIGGDCTWTGCVPSKALIKAAKVAHEVRIASHYGVVSNPPVTDMTRVREYVRGAIQAVYKLETPEELKRQGVEVLLGEARFLDPQSIFVDGGTYCSKTFLLTTGARPLIPPIAGLAEVPFLTYEQIFENDRLPKTMTVIGGGPIGMEIAQAYQRLGAQVTVIASQLLEKEDPDVQELMQGILEREGVRFVRGRAKSAHTEDKRIVVTVEGGQVRGEMLLVASGRRPNVNGLDLEKAGVKYSEKGIPVDHHLQTNVKNIYASGDVAGGYQFTHFAGWQAFQAARNALLPGSSSGFTDVVPRVTFLDPEVAHVGLTEEQARSKYGKKLKVCRLPMSNLDRAVCENDREGFIKMMVQTDGTVVGATIVAARAGETLSELILAVQHKINIRNLAGAIHAYPTYSTGIQQMAADATVAQLLSGTKGKIIHILSRMML